MGTDTKEKKETLSGMVVENTSIMMDPIILEIGSKEKWRVKVNS
jgi:hypothetical protein